MSFDPTMERNHHYFVNNQTNSLSPVDWCVPTTKSKKLSSNFVNDWLSFRDWKISDKIGTFENIQSQSNLDNTCVDPIEFNDRQNVKFATST